MRAEKARMLMMRSGAASVFFDFILLAGGKVQAPCAVILRDDIVFDTEGDLPSAAASTVF